MKERLKPYPYKGWMIHHYLAFPEYNTPEQFMACKEWRVLRASTKEEIEKMVDDRKGK